MRRLADRIRPAVLQSAIAEQDELDNSVAVFGSARRNAESIARTSGRRALRPR
jgi:hypothetical protein